MAQDLLKVEHLAASVEDAEILKDVSLRIGRGETHVIMGPNGAGKSTLAGVLMGNPAYTVRASGPRRASSSLSRTRLKFPASLWRISSGALSPRRAANLFVYGAFGRK